MDSCLKTLQEKYGNAERDRQNSLAKFMKRRRIDQNRTLEEVSKGICSPSYLSKIENCQVDVDAYYFQSLFDKLDLMYENVKSDRQIEFFPNLMKLYLLEQFSLLEDNIKDMVKATSYCETELELMVLLNNIINRNYDEAEKMIKKLEDVRKSLTKDELFLLAFLITLFYYRTNQINNAIEQLEALCDFPSDIPYYSMAVIDLSVDVYYVNGNESRFFEAYSKLKRCNHLELLMNRNIIHELQKTSLLAKNGDVQAIDSLEIQIVASKSYQIDPEKMTYYTALINYYAGNYQKALEIVNISSPSARILSLEAMILNHLNDFNKSVSFLTKINKSIIFYKGEEAYQNYLEYIREKIEQYSYAKLLSFLKIIVLPQIKENVISILYEEEIQEYLFLSYELGKYKEVVRLMIKMGKLEFLKKS